MPRFTYIGPYDEADVVGIARVKQGETFDVTDEQAVLLSEQPSNFKPAKASAKADTTTEA